jgi:hypothetical protein
MDRQYIQAVMRKLQFYFGMSILILKLSISAKLFEHNTKSKYVEHIMTLSIS